ncbi:transferrin-binding protein-like solute binding protein [Psychrobacter lutiphocae]|uniref:transferrin-binding protein-like solute binding protein n=1 Tax=Psychrobacter lutiphocae TaxID=540500 RepID=UPI00037C69EA|nr:transferrin-binding protein-like solute binding protein [Psychrobacter lutiphocae]
MSPIDHSILANATAKKINTPLKASVVLISSVILASCGSDSGYTSYYSDPISIPEDNQTTEQEADSNDTVGNENSDVKSESNDNTAESDSNGSDIESESNDNTDNENNDITGSDIESNVDEDDTTAETTDDEITDDISDALEKAKAEAEQSKQEAERLKAELEKVKAEAEAALAEAEKAKQDLEDALSASGGNTEALQAAAEEKAAQAEEAIKALQAAQQAAQDALAAAQAKTEEAQGIINAAAEAQDAAKIKNAPESAKSGVQTINVGTTAAGLPSDFTVTTRDFDIGEDNVIARADIASNNLLPKVDVNISGAGDKALSNGFMSHNDTTKIPTQLGELPLEYTSVYKDYGDDMRIGHIDGAASLSGTNIPVDGVAALGNATQAANVPTEGTVGYTGDATHRKLGLGNEIEFGSSVFTADFVAKSLEGKLSFAQAGDIALKAGIDGNQYSGAAADNAGYATEGGFYGGDAQYLGGVYEGNGAQGTYGAKSDVQTAAEQAALDAQAKADAAQAAIAEQQAAADAAKAAAEKAQADAQKAQAALEQAKANLENAGDGESALESALERARLAEEAQQAAEEVAIKAQAAEAAAKEAQAAAEKAQQAAEQEALDAKAAADKAIGDAKAEAEKLVAEANTAADAAKAEAEKATAAAAQAAKDTEAANKEKQEALTAKAEAEAAAAEAQARADAAEILANQFDEPDSVISGFQDIGLDDKSTALANKSASYDTLVLRENEAGNSYFGSVAEVSVSRGETLSNGFSKTEGSVEILGRNALGSLIANDLNYTSVYNNFDKQMQIGHVYGDIRYLSQNRSPVSTTFVQGNATNLGDLQKLADGKETTDGKAEYAGVATYKAGDTLDVDGKSKFDVDFVNKSVSGELTFTTSNKVTIGADIKGNTFTGNVNGINTSGGFFGKGANYLGGVYAGNGVQGTYGAERVKPVTDPVEPVDPNAPVNPDVAPDPEMTGFQSTTLSSKEKTLPFGLGQLENAIGYVAIRDDASDFTETTTKDGAEVPVDNGQGNNFTSFDKGVVRGDMVQPASVLKPIAVDLKTGGGKVTVDAGKGSFNPTLNYKSVYKSFDAQMQVGHVYGDLDSAVGAVSRVANVYVQGHLTAQEDIDYLKQVNEGKASYAGSATYIENIHLGDTGSFAPVDGTSNFDVDFVNNSVKGELAFTGDFKYNPTGKIGIEATIDGNTFAGNVNGIDTAGGFYGEDAQFLGGIYQDASVEGGKGTTPGTGTKFQGTFGAEKVQ